MGGQSGRGRFERGNSLPVQRAQPAVLAPDHFLDRRLASQHAAAAIGQGPADEINHVGVAVRRFDEIGMAGPLEDRVRAIARGQHMGVGMDFVGTSQIPRAGQSHRVIPVGAALGGQKIVVAIALVDVRAFGETERRAVENLHAFADEFPLRDRVFLEHDSGETVVPRTVVPEHVQEVFPAIVVVKKRWVETAAVHIDGVGPFAVDASGW